MRVCKKCGRELTMPRIQLCPECKDLMKKLNIAEKACQSKKDNYKEDKTTEKLKPGTDAWKEATPYQRMDSMGLSAVNAECTARGITYKIAQDMYYAKQLPEDWGLLPA